MIDGPNREGFKIYTTYNNNEVIFDRKYPPQNNLEFGPGYWGT